MIEEIIGQEIAAAAPIRLRRVPKCNRENMAWLAWSQQPAGEKRVPLLHR